nr:MAG TPA: hypothetical protein [Caudoviricetes sp.]
MTITDFSAALEAAGLSVYTPVVPAGAVNCLAWHTYGAIPFIGDNGNVLNAPQVQIDILTDTVHELLIDDITAVLWTLDLPYSIQSDGYDPDYGCRRTILQMVVI